MFVFIHVSSIFALNSFVIMQILTISFFHAEPITILIFLFLAFFTLIQNFVIRIKAIKITNNYYFFFITPIQLMQERNNIFLLFNIALNANNSKSEKLFFLLSFSLLTILRDTPVLHDKFYFIKCNQHSMLLSLILI